MSSDIDQKKLSVATDWIGKLANGINPIDGSILPDSDVVNNVHISRCLFFVSNLLEDMGKKKNTSKKQYEQEFQLTPENREDHLRKLQSQIASFDYQKEFDRLKQTYRK